MTELRIPLTEEEYRRAIIIKETMNLTWRDLFITALTKLGQVDINNVLDSIDKNIDLLKSQASGNKVAMLDLSKNLIRLITNENYTKAYSVVTKIQEYIKKQLELSNIGGGRNE